MTKLTILLDENITNLDNMMKRVSVCAVEVPEGPAMEELNEIMNVINQDNVRYGDIKKMHFSELAEAQRSAIIEQISKIDVTAKMYVYYFFDETEKSSKYFAMSEAVKHLMYIHRTNKIDIKIEHADEYLKTDLKPLLAKDEVIFILPDGFLSVFVGKLDNTSSKVGTNDRMYTLIREKLRLQVFTSGLEKRYLTSNNRL